MITSCMHCHADTLEESSCRLLTTAKGQCIHEYIILLLMYKANALTTHHIGFKSVVEFIRMYVTKIQSTSMLCNTRQQCYALEF